MNYPDLLAQFDEDDKIPYSDLLETNEWKERRLKIIQRDKSCCTNCGKTSSFFHLNFNISFQKNDKLFIQNISRENNLIDIIKKELNIEVIDILKSPYEGNLYCGISEKGHLFIVNWDELKHVPKNDLVVHKGETQSGSCIYVIVKSGQEFLNDSFNIPTITEKSVVLHVHHKFYVYKNLPWEYNDDALITLCNWCHWSLHETTSIPIYKLVKGELYELDYKSCYRCNGAGIFPEFKHVRNGVCFRCKGKKYEELIIPNITL